MHDHVRDLGRNIVREENNQNPYKRSRIWVNRDAINMLKGTDCVEALKVDMKGEDYVLTGTEFKQLSRLRYLVVSNGRLAGNFKEVLPNIRWLRLYRCDSVPTYLNLKKLVILDFQECSVSSTEVPSGSKKLLEMFCYSSKNLAISSSFLSTLPSSLVKFAIFNQERLPSLANLSNLTVLHLNEVGIREIPGLGELKLLTTLRIIYAPNLDNLDGLENLLLVKGLSLKGCSVLEKLPSLANLTKLEKLKIIGCLVLAEINGVGELRASLSHLELKGCFNLTGTVALHSMVKLETLELVGLELTNMLPLSLSMFTKHLVELRITFCQELIEVIGIDTLESLELLDMEGCESVRKLQNLSGLIRLRRLNVTGCTQLTEISGLGRLEALNNLYMSGCESIKELPNLSDLKNLRELHFKKCGRLKEVNGLEGLELIVFEADKRLKVRYVLKSVGRYGKQLLTSGMN
ncbi:Putative adenylate cyclase regulatory protein [Linum perenne]